MLEALFKPNAVAVVGASGKELNLGNRIIKNLLDFGFKGQIYPINPKLDEIWGVKAYKSILDVPTEVDVVHMAIAAHAVPQAIEDCGSKNVKFVILNSGGFTEIGPVGAAIEEDCIARAKKNNIRIFGPNCQGIINTDPEARAYCNFTFTKPDVGAISIVALSGGVAELIHQTFAEMGVGTRMYASNGNACDVSIPEIIRYYGNDDGTKVIVLYFEGLREPKAFLEVAQEVASKKPILAMKAGRTEEGAKAAASHTGGLAKRDITTDLIFEKTGILSFRDETELCEAAFVFATQPVPKGERVGLLTNTGGPAVIATDVLAGGGLTIPALSDKTVAFLKERLLPESSIRNPIDVLATANGGHFRAALDALMDEDVIDSVYINFVTPFFVDNESIAKEIVEVNLQQKKPIVCNLMTDRKQWKETVSILKDGGVPCYTSPGGAARALIALTKYGQISSHDKDVVKTFDDVKRSEAEEILKKAKKSGRKMLPASDVYEILNAYGIPVADWRMADSAAEAEKAAVEIGFPVVVKADSESIVRKSDEGGVAVNLKNTKAVSTAVKQITKKFKAHDMKFFVQKYIPGGKEFIIGAKAEDGIGHLIMFGIGGIYVEIFKDVAFKLSPVKTADAKEMLASLNAAPLLKGVRGEKGLDEEKIIEIIQRISQMVGELSVIQEIDLNPVMAFEDRVFVVDARMVL
jgi:acetate---CoA ligase (ADP-forming)